MSAFFSLYRHQFVRLGVGVPPVAIAEPATNADRALDLVAAADKEGVALLLFPELCLSAYAIDDLLFQDAVLDAVAGQIGRLIAASRTLAPGFVVGAPLRWQGHLYNCGLVIHGGHLLGVVPKVFLPNYREFYERRHFTSGEGVRGGTITIAGHAAPFGVDLIFAAEGPAGFTFHVEICEDLWVPQPPSALGAAAGAELLLNLSASSRPHARARRCADGWRAPSRRPSRACGARRDEVVDGLGAAEEPRVAVRLRRAPRAAAARPASSSRGAPRR